jgi:CTD kinase subunit beta
MAPLLYPPHSIALACVYLAALLLSFESVTSPKVSDSECRPSSDIAEFLGKSGSWEVRFQSKLEDVQGRHPPRSSVLKRHCNFLFLLEIAHAVMDLLLHETTTSTFNTSSTHTSPSTPQSPSPYSHPPLTSAVVPPLAINPPSIPHRPDQLTRLKIMMRQNDVQKERRRSSSGAGPSPRESGGTAVAEAEGLGRNEGTVRFLFGPPGSVLAGS